MLGKNNKRQMGIHKYNRLKAAIKRVQSGVLFDSAEREQARTQFKIVLAEKEKTGTWLSEQMGHSISTVFTLDDQPLGSLGRFQSKKVQPSVEQLYEIARHLDVDVKELLVSSK